MKQTAVLLPTDNRPITYVFPQYICQLANLDILIPSRHLMGSLLAPTDLNILNRWLDEAASKIKTGAILICLDTLLYGGLIPSRRSADNLETVLVRANHIANLKKRVGGRFKIYAQSSIMRISDNYDNTEEKIYWSEFGREIFDWSQKLHQKELRLLKSENELKTVESSIDPAIRNDYLTTRKRNFTVNQKMIDYVVKGDLDFLIFSQDDSGQFGLNVSEKNKLIALAAAKGSKNVLAYAGADEMLMTLIARYLNDERKMAPNIALHYSAAEGAGLTSNFEGQNIGASMRQQASAQRLKIVNADIANEAVDFHVIVHTGIDKQGDHMWLPGLPDLRVVDSKNSAKVAIRLIEQAKRPIVICDLAYSNGADPILIDRLFKTPELFSKIWAYGGWNTTGNTVGSALAIGSACLRNSKDLNESIRKKLLFIRLMDDWAYQTQVRKEMQANQSDGDQQLLLDRLMDNCAKKLASVLDFNPGTIHYTLPWKRTFEVEINLDSQISGAFP
jgi:hypothetical protein